MTLDAAQREAYRRDGFIVVPDVLSSATLAALDAAVGTIVSRAASTTAHDDVYDLEPSHTAAAPRVRRIKRPHLLDPAFAAVTRDPSILAVLRALIGPAIRFDQSKLNMKSAEYGSPVEWHQDWAFYPHTNDDLCAMGVMLDDCTEENGPLLCIPGSHLGPVLDHHANGAVVGAIDPAASGIDFSRAVACSGRAGSISVHHVRTLHGSALNRSARPRRLLLLQYAAADAWPLPASHQPGDWDAWRARVVCGEVDLTAPRCTAVPVRLPLPPPRRAGSIYETQRDLASRFFEAPVGAEAAGG
jgi:ectoine hydroxylase-related dioxygenase (phytanoyl-CoA dioxygenase family)